MRILFLHIVVNFWLETAVLVMVKVLINVYVVLNLSVKGFTAWVEIASGFNEVSFPHVVYHYHFTFAFLFFFLSP